MIDVLLVLIIIFMVLTPLTSMGLRTLVPQPLPPDREDQHQWRDIVVTVRKHSLVLINSEPVDLSNLSDRLAQSFRVRGDGVIFVRGDKDLEFRRIAEVIDIAKGSGFQRVVLTAFD